ncbi:MAG: thioredoxin-like domain-containing protein [Bacteroidota bacterium]
MKKLIFLALSFFMMLNSGVLAQDGYRMEFEIDNFSGEELYLGFYYGDKQYLKDTARINEAGKYVFEGEEKLPGGVYIVVMPPSNQIFQILMDEDQQFSVKTDSLSSMETMQVTGSKENKLFYDYMQFLNAKRPVNQELQQQKQAAAGDEQKIAEIDATIEKLNKEVRSYQLNLIEENPNSLAAALIKANIPVEFPDFEGTEEEQQEQKWRHMQNHYFDNIDLSDPRLARTPFLFQRIDYYINSLTVQHPDTIAQAIDYILEKAKPAEDTYKYYLIHFLNEYASSKVVGFDAVYVHLAENYYGKGMAPWTEQEALDKILDNAKTLKPLLIGKVAPDIQLEKRDGSKISLHDVDSEYTVLYFWRYDCGHCKKSTPVMKEFYEKFKDRGVELMAVCVKFTDDIPECWKYIDENEIGDWLHTVDTYLRSKYTSIYDVKTTPQMYILNKDKEIISKRIGAEQLEEVMDKIIEHNSKGDQP